MKLRNFWLCRLVMGGLWVKIDSEEGPIWVRARWLGPECEGLICDERGHTYHRVYRGVRFIEDYT